MQRDEGVTSQEINFVLTVTSLKCTYPDYGGRICWLYKLQHRHLCPTSTPLSMESPALSVCQRDSSHEQLHLTGFALQGSSSLLSAPGMLTSPGRVTQPAAVPPEGAP